MSGNQLPRIGKIFGKDDDEDDFKAPAGSNLAAIFGESRKSQDQANIATSLQYQSPKQSTRDRIVPQAAAPSATKRDVLLAKAVHAFKLQNGEYVSIGKLGLALTGGATSKQCHLILYRGTQDYVSIATIAPDFVYTVQPKNYASYYDSNKDNWSILFDSEEFGLQLACHICVCKYFSRTMKAEDILCQDLNAVTGEITAGEGKTVSIKYTMSGELIQPFKIDHNLKESMTLEISRDNNWEQLLVGTKIGQRRFMILPPSKQIGLGPGFPRERDIGMEIEVESIIDAPKESVLPVQPPEPSYKATIISRMAKMGQSILPKLPPSTTTDSEDTEDERYHKLPRHKKAESMDSSLQKKNSNPSLDIQAHKKPSNRDEFTPAQISVTQRPLVPGPMVAWSQNPMQSQYVNVDPQLYSLQPTAVAQANSTIIDPSLNVFLSETRTQNAEIRMGMSKIADNVQKLLDKFHDLELQKASTPTSDKMLDATLKMLLEVNKTRESSETRNIKVSPILGLEEDSRDELRLINDQLTARVNAIEKELTRANDSLAHKDSCLDHVSHEKDFLTETNVKLNNQIRDLETALAETRITVSELSADSKRLKDLKSDNEEKCFQMEQNISELSKKCEKLEEIVKSDSNGVKPIADNSKEIKRIMNDVFQTLIASFTEESYSSDYIKDTIAKTIKRVTLSVLDTSKKSEESILSRDDSQVPNETESISTDLHEI